MDPSSKPLWILICFLIISMECLSLQASSIRSPEENESSREKRQAIQFPNERRKVLRKRTRQPIESTEASVSITTFLQEQTPVIEMGGQTTELYESATLSELEHYKQISTIDCKQVLPGYYASVESNCRMWHMCANGLRWDFLCPTFTLFSQKLVTCTYPEEVDCPKSPEFYDNNKELYKPLRRKKAKKVQPTIEANVSPPTAV